MGEDGLNRSVQDRRTAKEYLLRRSPFMSVEKNGVRFASTSLQSYKDILQVTFGESGVRADVRVRTSARYLTFELIAINDHTVSSVELANLPLALHTYVSRSLAYCRDNEFAAAVIPLNIETHSRAPGAVLIAEADARVRLEGAKFALLGCPTKELLDCIEQIEMENGLPHPTLNGGWARKSLEQARSYLFIDLSEATAKAVIDYAKAGSFGSVVVQDGAWNASHGTYSVNRLNFPNGEPGLKAVAAKIHTAGLKFGIHNLDMVIDKNDPLVQPVPATGFMMYPDRRRTLAAGIGLTETFLPTATSPEGLLAKTDKSRFHGRDLRIGNEIITYDSLQTVPPFGFTGCTRGAHGTEVAAHADGAPIENFSEFIGFYRPDIKSSLYEHVAQGEAEALDKFGFDYIYPDGTGENLGFWPDQPEWYIYNLLISKLFHYTKREVLWAHIPITDYSWHIFSRGNTTDYVHSGVIQHFDKVSIAGAKDSIAELQPFEFGWFGYLTHALDARATRPREMEYAWSKALAFGAAMSLETSKAALDGNGRTREILGRIKLWETLKLNHYFPEHVREQLKVPGREFALQRDSGGRWRVLPVEYSPERYLKSQDQWTFTNPYASQSMRMNIDAMPSLANFGDQSNIVLLDPARPLNIYTSGNGPLGNPARHTEGLDFRLNIQEGTFHAAAVNRGTTGAGWGCAELLLDGAKDLRQNRALSTWVDGDGSGAYLHFVLEDPGRWLARDYYIRLDFKGRRYIEIPEAAKGEIYDFAFPYSNYWALRNFNFNEIGRMYVFLTGVPAGHSAEARFSRLEALHETEWPVQNIKITVNGKSFHFPSRFETDWYLEYGGRGVARIFDANGFLKQEVSPKGFPPIVHKGPNDIAFLCDRCGPVRITLSTYGEPLR